MMGTDSCIFCGELTTPGERITLIYNHRCPPQTYIGAVAEKFTASIQSALGTYQPERILNIHIDCANTIFPNFRFDN